MNWSFTIEEYDLPSANVLMRQHWGKLNKDKRILEAIIYSFDPPEFPGPVEVNIIRYYGKRKRPYDPDNVYFAVKPLLDVLKKRKGRAKVGLGVIQEDNSDIIRELRVSQERSDDGIPRVAVSISDLPREG
jgi:hypothetical protein